jgi:hypothetical protein
MGSSQTTVFLSKSLTGAGVTDKAQAAACSIDEKTQLVCEGKPVGVSTTRTTTDMAPIAAGGDVQKGFSVDANNVIHWKWSDAEVGKLKAFQTALKSDPQYTKNPNEAKFGLLQSKVLTGNQVMLYFQLGCPGNPQEGQAPMADHQNMGTHKGAHDAVYEGVAKAIAL